MSGNAAKNTASKNKQFKRTVLPWIFSFIAALALWIYVSSIENPSSEAEFSEIPITFTENEHGLSIISGTNPTLTVTVRGKKSVTSAMTAASFSAIADISDIKDTGTHTVRVTVTTPEDVTIIKEKDKLEVFLDKKITKEIDIDVRPRNYVPNEGYKIYFDDRIKKSPEKITVTGPESELNKIVEALVTLPFDDGISDNKTITAYNMEFSLIDSEENMITSPYITTDVSDVTLTIPVYQTKTIKTNVEFSDTKFNRNNAVVSVSPEYLKIEGVVEDIKNISSYTVTVDDTIAPPQTLIKEISETDFTVIGDDKTVTIKIDEKPAG
ncbi:MAG: hypothetical protein IJT91_06380 [Clostridia bacterium]|nr:hypothetical protein [Clostridia bacterium]